VRTVRILAALAIVLAACAPPVAPSNSPVEPGTSSGPSPPDAPVASQHPTPTATAAHVATLIDGASLRAHLAAFAEIADGVGDGHRTNATEGFRASVTHVAEALERSGYAAERTVTALDGVETENVITELPGTGEGVIVVGAHVDSVRAGPGINDNASGVAALLVIADRLRELPSPERTIRFAFWGAEEGGPFGSRAYLASLDASERDAIVAYLNVDMIGSPNAVRFVYAEGAAAPGSERLTDAFAAHFSAAGLPWAAIDLEGDSDHGPFIDAGIPTGGIFSGGIEPVTSEQATAFGATAGEPADPCSHAACDTIDNVDLGTLEEMAEALASVLVSLAGG
jgi:aminopeptidase S